MLRAFIRFFFCWQQKKNILFIMDDSKSLEKDIESVLRAHGLSLGEAQNVLDNVKSKYSLFTVDMNDKEAEKFLVTFKQVLYFAIFAHAPPVPGQASSKFYAWAWVKEYTEKFLNASDTAKFDKRTVIGGMADIFDRSLIALGRIKYTVYWSPQLRSEFMYVWQSLSERRMFLSGWNLEPSKGGSPSKRYWQKVKAVAEAMRNCWHLQPTEEEQSSPVDGPSGLPPPHDFFGEWSSSGEDDPLHQVRNGRGAGSLPIRMGVNRYPMEAPSSSTPPPPDTEWDSTIAAVMRREAQLSLSDPLEGWPTCEQEWATTIGRQVYSDGVFSLNLSSLPRHHIRSECDILTSAMKYVGAERVANEDFWTLDEEGNAVSILHGRDFVVWSLPQRAVCDCRHEYRMAVRLGPKASGKFAQHPLIKLENTPPGVRLSSARETLPFLASFQQVGIPAVANTDAQLGNSVYAYQSGEILFGHLGADSHILWRIVGQHSRAYGGAGTKTKLTQKAKVGFCPCCSWVSHVAIPGAYDIGEYYQNKATTMRLWQSYGPWGPRRHSAYAYVAENKYLPRDWDWAASTLNIRFPPLPYSVPTNQGGICDFLMYGLPTLQRSVPNIASIPEAGLDAMGNLKTIEPTPQTFPSPNDNKESFGASRKLPPVPKPSPPRFTTRSGDPGSATEGSAYESDWREYWSTRGWEWNDTWNKK